MRKLAMLSTLCLLFLFSGIASAKPESVIIGPYNASFDLNISQNYNVSTYGPEYGGTYGDSILFRRYSVTLKDSKYAANIALTHYGKLMDKNNETYRKSVGQILSSMCDDQFIQTVDQKIDGHNGLLYTSINCDPKNYKLNSNTVFLAEYWIDEVNDLGNTVCLITSLFPWENGTASLLKTIHVEEV